MMFFLFPRVERGKEPGDEARPKINAVPLFLTFSITSCDMVYYDLNRYRSHSEQLHRKPTKDFAPGYVRARDSAKLDNDDTTLTYVVGKQVSRFFSFSSSSFTSSSFSSSSFSSSSFSSHSGHKNVLLIVFMKLMEPFPSPPSLHPSLPPHSPSPFTPPSPPFTPPLHLSTPSPSLLHFMLIPMYLQHACVYCLMHPPLTPHPPLTTPLTNNRHQQNSSRYQTWVLLERPPTNENVDTLKFEQQKVQVDFRVADGLPEDTHQYVIKRDHTGSFELLTSPSPDNQERTYRLSVVDQYSTAAMTAVSLNIDPSESTGGQQSGADATPMFDSKRMPVVKLK